MIDKLIAECYSYIMSYDKNDKQHFELFLQHVSAYHWLKTNKQFIKKDDDIITFVQYSQKILKSIAEITDSSEDLDQIRKDIEQYVNNNEYSGLMTYKFDISMCDSKHNILDIIWHNEQFLNIILRRFNDNL